MQNNYLCKLISIFFVLLLSFNVYADPEKREDPAVLKILGDKTPSVPNPQPSNNNTTFNNTTNNTTLLASTSTTQHTSIAQSTQATSNRTPRCTKNSTVKGCPPVQNCNNRKYRKNHPKQCGTPRPDTSSGNVIQPEYKPSKNTKAEYIYWESVVKLNNKEAYDAYLKEYKNGLFKSLADAMLDKLKEEANSSKPQ